MFGSFVSDPPRHRKIRGVLVSVVAHGLVLALLILVPLFWPETASEHPNAVAVFLYNPPPPPPLALPRGSVVTGKPEPTPERTKAPPHESITVPTPEPEQPGIHQGSEHGSVEGMEEGVENGEVGGVPGGTTGGVIGGTGVALDYDHAPQPIRITKPVYTREGFIKKIEGVVELEILIGADGRVKYARVIESIPELDAAAIRCVMEWVFRPAIKDGHPVAILARAPVRFRIH